MTVLDKRVAQFPGVGRCIRGIDFYARPNVTSGSTSMTVSSVFKIRKTAPTAQSFFITNQRSGASAGWGISLITPPNTIAFNIYDSIGTSIAVNINVPLYLNAIYVVTSCYDNSEVRMAVNSLTNTAASPNGGYNAPNEDLGIGGEGSPGRASPDIQVHSLQLDETNVLTLAEMVAFNRTTFDNLVVGREIPTLASLEFYFNAFDVVNGAALATTWPDRSGNGVDLTKNGNPEAYALNGVMF